MDDLISRKMVITALEECNEDLDYKLAIRLVESMPAVQSEVITCSECKHMCEMSREYFHYLRCGQTGIRVQEYDFCSMAKRK